VPTFIEIGLSVQEEKIYENFECIFTLLLYLPLEKGVVLHMNNFESPSLNDDLCQLANFSYNWPSMVTILAQQF
jgi:hypothetical protein